MARGTPQTPLPNFDSKSVCKLARCSNFVAKSAFGFGIRGAAQVRHTQPGRGCRRPSQPDPTSGGRGLPLIELRVDCRVWSLWYEVCAHWPLRILL